MSGSRMGLLFKFPPGMELFQPALGEGVAVYFARLRLVAVRHQADQVMEILDPLAGAQVNTTAGAVDLVVVEKVCVHQRFLGSAGREPGVRTGMGPARCILYVPGQVKVLHLGSELGGEMAGVEQGDRANAAASFQLPLEEILDTVAQGSDHAHPGDDNSSSHERLAIPARREFGLPNRNTPSPLRYFSKHHRSTLSHLRETDFEYMGLCQRTGLIAYRNRTVRIGHFIVQGRRKHAMFQSKQTRC